MIVTRIKVKGFRGFIEEKEFDLSKPVVIIFGENGKGKSSLLNAIEWCLFGKEIVGKNTGIRERVNWEIKNRNSKDCEVRLELEVKENEEPKKFILTRRYISKNKDEVVLESPDEGDLKGEKAEKKLSVLLSHFLFKDFMSCVYQHQEVIRYILTQEPKDRNEAIDRLLGLSEYRNIMEGIDLKQINPESLENKLKNLKTNIEAKVNVWNSQIEEKEKELLEENVRSISKEEAESRCKSVREKLEKFCIDSKIEFPESIREKDPSSPEFIGTCKSVINKLRVEMPDVQEQNKIYEKIVKTKNKLTEFDDIEKNYIQRREKFDNFVKENGSPENLEKRIKEIEEEIKRMNEERERVDRVGAMIANAIEHLKSVPENMKNLCPVCGSIKENLIEHLKKEYKEKHEERLKQLDEDIKNKKVEKEKVSELLSKSQNLERDFKNWEKEYKNKKSEIRDLYNIPEREEIKAFLNSKVREFESKLEEIKKKVQEKQKILTDFDRELSTAEKIMSVLKLKEKREEARKIKKSTEWKQLEGTKENLSKLKTKIQDILNALRAASQEEAKERINTAKEGINKYFQRIIKHPLINNIKIEVSEDKRTGGNEYSFKDQEGRNITPILSQGQLNVLALCIFLSMAEASQTPFSFIMLDDPSQSLGNDEKKHLAGVLNEIAERKNLIISTMDNELLKYLKDKITKEKTVYEFRDWSPDKGPDIISGE